MDITETIRASYSEVSSVQKRIADYCMESFMQIVYRLNHARS